VTFLVLLTSAGSRSTPGVLIVPLQREFGWNRTTISAAVSINLLLFGFGSVFAAALMERFGVRRVVLAALLLVGTGAGLTLGMRAPWQLDLLWGVVVGLGTSAMASVLSAVVANRWFVRRRGLVLGLLTASTATGQLVFLPALAWLAAHLGWRWAAAAVAAAALVASPLVAALMRDRPEDLGLRAYGAEGDGPPPASEARPAGSAWEALRIGLGSRDFFLLAGSFFICGATTNGLIGTHLIPASMDHGLPEVQAAGLLATIGAFDVVGTTVSGWLTDRLDPRWLLFWYYGLRGLSLLFLPYALSLRSFGLVLFVVFYGLDWVATVPPTVALAADRFGKERVGVIFGWIFAAHQLGAAVAAYGAGAARTWLGDYQLAFMAAGLLAVAASGLVLRIGRAVEGVSPAGALS
jgi:sugar phosphate permease